jgi:hypothetical protein
MNWKGFGRKLSSSTRHTLLDALGKSTKNATQDYLSSSRGSNRLPPEFEYESFLLYQPIRLIEVRILKIPFTIINGYFSSYSLLPSSIRPELNQPDGSSYDI